MNDKIIQLSDARLQNASVAGGLAVAQTNPFLSGYAVGYAQDPSKMLANFIAPPVQVGSTNAHYKVFDVKNAMAVSPTDRPLGSAPRNIIYNATDATISLSPEGLATFVDDFEVGNDAAAGYSGILARNRISSLISACQLSREVRVWSYIASKVTAESGKGVWSSGDVDPVQQLDEQLINIGTEIGRPPNRIVFGLGAWYALRNNKRMQDRVKLTLNKVVTEGLLLDLLARPVELKIGEIVYDLAAWGNAASPAQVVGNEVYLFYSQDAPSPDDMSPFKTFTMSGISLTNIKSVRDERATSTFHMINWDQDLKQTATIGIRRITIA